jgi:hypothetical protein
MSQFVRAAAALAFGAVIASGCGSSQPRAGVTATPATLEDDIVTIAHRAPRRVGRQYACAVVTERSSGGVLVFVTGSDGARRAHALRERLARPRAVGIRRTSARWQLRRMSRIHRSLVASVPEVAGESWNIAPAGFAVGGNRCPPVKLRIERRGDADPRMERWAQAAVRRYGADRVKVVRGETRE